MTVEQLKSKGKEEVMEFIRERLSFDRGISESMRYMDQDLVNKQHKRFEMSGYDSGTGRCTIWNTSLINEFADLGIYDYTAYLFLDFYKGIPTLYYKYFHENECLETDNWLGLGTTEIIYNIFELTIFSGKDKRRRG